MSRVSSHWDINWYQCFLRHTLMSRVSAHWHIKYVWGVCSLECKLMSRVSAHPAAQGVWTTDVDLGEWQEEHSQVENPNVSCLIMINNYVFPPTRTRKSLWSVSAAPPAPHTPAQPPAAPRTRWENIVNMWFWKVGQTMNIRYISSKKKTSLLILGLSYDWNKTVVCHIY